MQSVINRLRHSWWGVVLGLVVTALTAATLYYGVIEASFIPATSAWAAAFMLCFIPGAAGAIGLRQRVVTGTNLFSGWKEVLVIALFGGALSYCLLARVLPDLALRMLVQPEHTTVHVTETGGTEGRGKYLPACSTMLTVSLDAANHLSHRFCAPAALWEKVRVGDPLGVDIARAPFGYLIRLQSLHTL